MIHATILGRLGRDPEQRTTSSGTQILNLAVATDHGYGDSKVTMWIRASLFGARGEKLAQYLSKGSQVLISGELYTREYDKDGVTRTSLEMRIAEIELAGSKQDSHQAQNSHQAQSRQPARQAPAAARDFPDDDVPF
jgi:single-strand DNA-binding protein